MNIECYYKLYYSKSSFWQYKYISSSIKIEALEEKIRSEMESLNVKISGMEEGLTTYSDLER